MGKVATLHRWLTRAHATNIHALQRFVRTLRQDLGAVEGAVTEPWSNGPVEGHINRLKTLRRQMYGRAGVELFRARLLPLPARHALVVPWTLEPHSLSHNMLAFVLRRRARPCTEDEGEPDSMSGSGLSPLA